MSAASPDLPVFSANPAGPEFYLDPYPHYARMHELGPAFVWREYGLITFARHRLVNALLRDRRLGREATHVMSREEAGLPEIPEHVKPFYDFEANSILEREPPVHTRLRKLVNRAFVSRNIEGLAPAIATLANGLIDEMLSNDSREADLLPAYCEKIPVIVIARLLGVPDDKCEQLLAWSHAMVAMYQFNRSRQIEEEAVAATLAFSAYVRELAAERRKSPREDLLTALVETEASGDHLSMDELVTTAVLLLNAGHEATVHALGNSVKALLTNGADPGKLFDSREASARAVEELLRFDPPLHMFTRFVLEDMEIEGATLKRGQTVALLLGAANHDPQVFRDPSRLDFARGGEGQLAFGAGIHFCLGAPLARLEMAIALPLLFERLPGLKLKKEPVRANRYHFNGLESLDVRF
ncbi:MAG: cytochrome P450 [Nitratireductor sp.]|nr:cytochrome P450 [Nitratireductor sp.]